MMSSFLLIIAAFFTSALSALVGLAGGTVLLSCMTFFFQHHELIPLHGATQVFSNISRTYLLRHYVNKKIFIYFLAGVPLGVFIGITLLKNFKIENYAYILIVILIFYTLFKPKNLPPIKIPIPAFFLLGVVTSLLGLLIGAVGPFQAPFYLRDDLNKNEMVATQAATQTIVHFCKIPSFLYLGFNYKNYWLLIIGLAIAATLGSDFGVKKLNSFSEEKFKLLFKIVLFISALRLLYHL